MSDSLFVAPSLESLAAMLPGYDVEAFIAEGGMGAVYKARQRSLDRDVAIKVLPRELGEDPAFRRSFESEARAMARLNHPNLISIFDSGEVGGLLYLVMEFVRGKSLFHSAHNRAIDPQQAVEITVGVCRGLAHAHDHGIIHRDVKPANILLTPKREPKLGDFGLARLAGPESQGLAMGTPGYTAPEVTQNPDHADRRSDIFAVGVIFYELLAGCSPAEGCPPPSKVAGSDPALDVVWQTATASDPADRYPSASAMASALEMWQSGTADLENAGSRRRKRSVGAGSHWPLARNLVIIALLVVAIAFTWKRYRQTQAERAAMSAAAAESSPAPPARPAPVPAPDADPPPAELVESTETETDPPAGPAPVLPEPAEETPAQSLLRLRDRLVAGERDEMPAGTVAHDGSDYFWVAFPMTWDEAARFAASFGGHLPLVGDPSDLTWLASRIPGTADKNRSLHWIGARRSAGQGWRSADASPWPLKDTPQGNGDHAAITREGEVVAASATDTHPFLIQWQRDGSNPASLREILKRTRESLAAAASPAFPHGTRTRGESHLLVVRDPVTAGEARELAELGGGHLMAPADAADAEWLESQVAKIPAPDGLWLGASRDGLEWKWHTGEPWTFARWATRAPSGDGTELVIVPGSGWRDAPADQTASGFIIEWSADPPPAIDSSPGESAEELRAKAEELLAGLDRKRQQDLAENAKTFGWNLDVWLRTNSKNDVARWRPGVERLKSSVRGNRVPSNLQRVPKSSFSARMLGIARDALEKEKSVDAAFTAKATNLRDAYVARLTEIRDAERERGQADLARDLTSAIRAAADIDGWVESFDAVTPKIDTSIPVVTIVSANYGTGGSNADVTARVTRLVEQEQRAFRVTPGDLGTDPSPGWNKGLTIVYEIDGTQHRKEWGENSEVTPTAFDGK